MGNQTCWTLLGKIHQFRLDEAILEREQLQQALLINSKEKNKLDHKIKQNMDELSSCYNSAQYVLAYTTNYLAEINSLFEIKSNFESDAEKLNHQVNEANLKVKQHFHQKQVLAKIEELRLQKNKARSLKIEEQSMDDLIAIRQTSVR